MAQLDATPAASVAATLGIGTDVKTVGTLAAWFDPFLDQGLIFLGGTIAFPESTTGTQCYEEH